MQEHGTAYEDILDRAASWGLASLQYDTGFATPSAMEEVRLLPYLVKWMGMEDCPFCGLVDPNRVIVGGHSRGGKVAALVHTLTGGYPLLLVSWRLIPAMPLLPGLRPSLKIWCWVYTR